jgi:DNA-binding NarL/FixJ family response regulator
MTAGVTAELSPRQREVVDEIRRGKSYEEIARELRLSRRTVAVHVNRVAAKLENPDGLRPYLAVFEWARRECRTLTN